MDIRTVEKKLQLMLEMYGKQRDAILAIRDKVLPEFDGKPFGKRFKTAVKKAVGDMDEIRMWKVGDTMYEIRLTTPYVEGIGLQSQTVYVLIMMHLPNSANGKGINAELTVKDIDETKLVLLKSRIEQASYALAHLKEIFKRNEEMRAVIDEYNKTYIPPMMKLWISVDEPYYF